MLPSQVSVPSRMLFLIALTSSLLSVSGCKTREINTVWTDTPRQIDGNTADWQDVAGLYLPDQDAGLAVSNDESYVYLLFRTTDPMWAGTIKRTGLTLYLDSEGGQDKDFFIKYTGGPSREVLMTMAGRSREGRGNRDGGTGRPDREPPEDQPPQLTCYVKDRIIEKPIPLDGSEGPAAAFDTCQGFFVYEFRVPLSESTVRSYGIGAQAGAKVAVGAEWGDMGERPSMGGGMRGGMDGGPGGGMGGRGGGIGGRGGGMGGPPGGQRPEMPQKREVWFKTVLATVQEDTAPKE